MCDARVSVHVMCVFIMCVCVRMCVHVRMYVCVLCGLGACARFSVKINIPSAR